jgi:hypothetical protein
MNFPVSLKSSKVNAVCSLAKAMSLIFPLKVALSIGPDFPGNSMQAMRMLRYLKDVLPPAKFRAATKHYFASISPSDVPTF